MMNPQSNEGILGGTSSSESTNPRERYTHANENTSFDDEVSYDRRTQMLSIQYGLEAVLGKIDPTGQKTHIQTEITQAWIDVAGDSVAAHTEAVFMRGSVLVVWLDSQIWVQELTLMAQQYKERINEVLGSERVVECRFTLRDSEKKRFNRRFKTNT